MPNNDTLQLLLQQSTDRLIVFAVILALVFLLATLWFQRSQRRGLEAIGPSMTTAFASVVKEWQADKETLTTTVNRQTVELQAFTQDNAKLKQELGALKSDWAVQRGHWQDDVTALEAKARTYQQQVNDLQTLTDDLKRQVEELRDSKQREIATLSETLAAREDALTNAQRTITELQQQVQEIQTLRCRVEELEKKVKTMLEERDSIIRERDLAIADRNAAQKAADLLKSQLDSAYAQLASVEARLADTLARAARQDTELESIRAELLQLKEALPENKNSAQAENSTGGAA